SERGWAIRSTVFSRGIGHSRVLNATSGSFDVLSHHVVPTSYLSKERRTYFWCSLQCCVINVDKSEPRPVAIRPLKVIHRTPMEIAWHRRTFSSRTLQLRKIVAQEHDSVAVIDDTIGGWVVGCTATVLRDVDVLDAPELH